MTEEPILLCEDSGAIRLLTLNRPRQMNALNAALSAAIIAAVDAAAADDCVSVIVLAETEKAFCAGADLKEAKANRNMNADAARRHGEASGRLYEIGDRTDRTDRPTGQKKIKICKSGFPKKGQKVTFF